MTINPNPQLNDSDLELLSAYIDRQLPAEDRRHVESRLSQEPALRETLDELRSTIAVLKALEPVRPPRSFTIDPATVQRPVSWWRSLMLPFGGLATMLLVGVLLVGVLRTGNSPSNATVASAPTADPAQLQIQTYNAQDAATAAAEATAAKAAPAELAPPASAPVQPVAPAAMATPAPTSAPAPTLAPAATAAPAAAASAPVDESAPAAADSQVAGARSANEAATLTGESVPPLTTPASLSPGTTTLQQAPPPEPAPAGAPLLPLLPIAGLLVLLVGALIIWLRRRKN